MPVPVVLVRPVRMRVRHRRVLVRMRVGALGGPFGMDVVVVAVRVVVGVVVHQPVVHVGVTVPLGEV